MKKTIVCLCVIFALLLTGCSSSTDNLSAEIERLKSQITALTEENNKLKDDIIEFESIINNSNDTTGNENNNNELNSNLDNYPMYKNWLEAEGYSKQERDMYLNVVSGVAEMQYEIENKWYDKGTRQLLAFITGKSISKSATFTEIRSIYDGLKSNVGNSGYSIMDTLDPDTDSAWRIFYFLQIVNEIEDDKFNGANLVKHSTTEDYLYSITGYNFNMQEVAEALGISVELVDIIVHASIDAGFNVTFDGYNVKA